MLGVQREKRDFPLVEGNFCPAWVAHSRKSLLFVFDYAIDCEFATVMQGLEVIQSIVETYLSAFVYCE